jgi:hypothetical protein
MVSSVDAKSDQLTITRSTNRTRSLRRKEKSLFVSHVFQLPLKVPTAKRLIELH